MQDSSSRIFKHNLEDLVEYQRFLERFKVAEEQRRLKDVLFGGQRFRSLSGEGDDC